MSKCFTNVLPPSGREIRRRLYSGEIFMIPGNEVTAEFVSTLLDMIESELGTEYRLAHQQLDAEEYFLRIGRLRKLIYTASRFHLLIHDVIEAFGYGLTGQAYDPARLRVVAHNGHLNPAAKPIYHGHRDTWYSNPESMITWWIPLHDVEPEETFEFYTDYFECPVKNDSEVFSFQSWTEKGQQNRIGWQNKSTGRVETYPSLLEMPAGERLAVAAKKGDLLLFSGQHLHQTRKNVTGKTRFSADFRTVDLADFDSSIGPKKRR